MTDDTLIPSATTDDDRPLIDPETGWNRLMVEQMARSIRVAHEINPDCWCIHALAIAPDDPFFMVESLNIGTVRGAESQLLVDTPGLSDEALAFVSQFDIGRRYRRPELEFARVVKFPLSDTSKALELLANAHLDVIRRFAAQVATRSDRWKWHRDDLRVQMNQLFAAKIPAPRYLDDIKHSNGSVATTDDFDQETGWYVPMILRMASAIRLAHSIDPSNWAVVSRNGPEDQGFGSVILQVGRLWIACEESDRRYLLVDRQVLSDDVVAQVRTRLKPRRIQGEEGTRYADVYLTDEPTPGIIEAVRDGNETVVRESSLAGGNRVVNTWHLPHLLSNIERVVGETLPSPDYLEEARASGGSMTIFEECYGVEASRLMARSIEIAHAASDRSWCLFRSVNRPVLMIGQVVAGGSKVSKRYAYVVDPSMIDQERLDQLLPHRLQNPPTDYSQLLFLNVPIENASNLLHGLEESHRGAISVLTRHYKLATLWQSHEEGFRKELEKTVDKPVPVPGFVLKPQPPGNVREAVRNHFASRGLSYTSDQIATFYTALQTKGFVVLSGISGTGKSKIAQHFVELLPDPQQSSNLAVESTGFMLISVKPYMKKRRRLVIPTRYYELLTPMERGQSYQVTVTIDGQQGTGRLWFRVHGGNDQYLLSFHQSLTAKINAWQVNDPIYLDPVLGADGDRVAEVRISSEPLIAEFAEPFEGEARQVEQARNCLFLSVRPDWRDSTSLLGYFNPLTERYQWTDFLHFLLRAVDNYRGNDKLAWFVILDEMNLAHVEYYFADLLSVIESGRQGETDKHPGFSREPLRITYAETVDDDVPPREIYLPPNLYIIGTVNMDETTHAFSPKVLDRAFTIELTEVDFSKYPSTVPETAPIVSDATKQAMLAAFTRSGKFHEIDKATIREIVAARPEIRTRLSRLNVALAADRFQFGYRIFDEICQYLANSGANGMAEFDEAFDAAIYMKVLPKFTGSEARLRSPLRSLFAWAVDPDGPVVPDANASADTLESKLVGAELPRVARRVHQMIRTLETDGFVSFG